MKCSVAGAAGCPVFTIRDSFFILSVKEVKSRESHLVFADDLKNLTKMIIIDNCAFIGGN